MFDEDNLPLSTKVPSRAHPAFLRTGRDDTPTRAAKRGLAELYTAWAHVEDTLAQVADKSKARTFLSTEHTKAVAKAEAKVKHLRDLERTHSEAIKNSIGKLSNIYAAEIRAHLRGKPLSELAKASADPAVARALYGVPAILLGLDPDEIGTLNDEIERRHAPDDYDTRASARTAIEVLDTAATEFHTKNLKRLSAFERSDDVILAKASAKKTEEAA